jgi:hypothetical protein
MSVPKAGALGKASDWTTVFPVDTDAWAAYTPTWSSTGTPPALGNGSISGAYTKIGRTVLYRIILVMGSTSTFGTGAYTFTLPVAAIGGSFPAGSMRILDASPAQQYMRHVFQNSVTVVAGIGDGASTFVAATVPITFATSDTIIIAGYYEAAS